MLHGASICYFYFLLFMLAYTALPCHADHIVVEAKPAERGPGTPLDIAAHQHKMFWLPPAEKTQQLIFEYLHNNGAFVSVDYDCPRDGKNIEEWFTSDYNFSLLADRYQYAKQKGALGFLSRDLDYARYLLKQPDQLSPILGLRIAYTATKLASQKARNPWLIARIYEGFLLPNIGEAYTVRWREFNQQQILEDASFAYDKAGEVNNEMATLRFITQYTDHSQEADWARIQAARLQAASGQYEQAIALLKAIQSPDMKGGESQIAVYTKLKAKKTLSAPNNEERSRKNSVNK